MNKKYLFSFLLLSFLILPLGINAAGGEACKLVSTVMSTLWMVGGVLVVIGWIVAGILYLTSIGSTERMGVGKKAITAAIVGTILIILAGAAYTIIADLMGYTLSAPGCK